MIFPMKILFPVLLNSLFPVFAQDDSFVDTKDVDNQVSVDLQKTFVVELEKLAERGDAKTQCELGIHYGKGDGVEQDYGTSVEWLWKAAEQG